VSPDRAYALRGCDRDDPLRRNHAPSGVSSFEHAEEVGVQLLLAYRPADLRVPHVHGSACKRALDKCDKTFEWVTCSNEAHGLSLDENVFNYCNRVARFLSKCLQGEAGPGS
jgi:hypothetical protein